MSVTNAQAILWQEDFTYPNGVKQNAPKWTTEYSGNSGRFEVRNNMFNAFDMNREGVWTSDVISLAGVNYAEIKMDIEWVGSTFRSNPDYIRVYYKIEGGEEVLMWEKYVNSIWDNSGDAILSKVIKGKNVQIVIRAFFDTWLGLAYCNVDNIELTEVKTFYSLSSGNWNDVNKWSIQPFAHSNRQPAGEVPTKNEGAIIGNGNNININVNNAELSFLEVIDNGTLTMNGRSLNMYRGGGITVENGGRIRNNGNIIFRDPADTDMTIDTSNGLDINNLNIQEGITLTLSGTGDAVINGLNLNNENINLDLDLSTTINGNISTSNHDNQLINKKSLSLTGNFHSGNRRFTVTNQANAIINWSGTAAVENRFNLYSNATGSEFNYSASGNQTIITPQNDYHTLNLSGSGTKTTSGNFIINDDLNIDGSATLSTNHNIQLKGDLSHSSSNTTLSGSGTLILNGANDQNINNTNAISFGKLRLNKINKKIFINNNISINSNLAFNGGIIESGNRLVIFNNGATQSGSNNNSFVNGPVRKIGNQNFLFPVGADNIYAPIEISNMLQGEADTHFTAQYFNQPAPNPNQKETNFSHISGAEYWDLSRTNGVGNCYVHLYWMDADRSEIIQPSDLIVAHYNSQTSKWEKFDAQVSGNSIRSSTRISSFSPFTFGSINGINPLPVEFLSFSGTSQKNGNLLKWQTATEHNNDYFSIEKSKDGKEWSACGKVAGNGDSFTALSYSYLDQHAAYGVTYYRLKQVDFNGEYDYSSIISVNNSNIPQFSTERAYPNPTNGELMVRYTTPEYGQITLTIQNLQGQPVIRKVLNAEAGSHTIEMDIADLANGLYLLVIQQNQNHVVERIVKQ